MGIFSKKKKFIVKFTKIIQPDTYERFEISKVVVKVIRAKKYSEVYKKLRRSYGYNIKNIHVETFHKERLKILKRCLKNENLYR